MASVLAPYSDGTILQATENRVVFCDAGGTPSGGTFNVGDLAIITPVYGGVAPTASSPWGYRCVTAGTPGTWVAIGGVTAANGATDALTAHAGGGQTSALALTASVNRISTVATAGDSVALPTSVPGLQVTIINDAANPLQVFGASTDTINDVATATGVMLPAYQSADFYSPVAGKWYSAGVVSPTTNVVQYISVALTQALIIAMYTTPIVVVPAQGSGTLIEVISANLDLIYGSAAYTSGGVAQLSYGTGVTYPASATIAASVFTTFSANQAIKVAGAMAVTATTNTLNAAVNFTNATGVFANAGTGGTGVLKVSYLVHTGLS